VSAVYASWDDAAWLDNIQLCLRSGDSFATGTLPARYDNWHAYLQSCGLLDHPLARTVLRWVREGYRLDFVSPFDPSQCLHPRFLPRLQRLQRALECAHNAPAHPLAGEEPLPIIFPNHPSVNAYAEFVVSELATFLRIGALVPYEAERDGPVVVHPMSVAVHPVLGKLRLCIDANYTNVFEKYRPVQFELLQDVLPLIQPGDWAFVSDLTKGYFHLPLHPSARRFLGVAYEGCTYVFAALPFGLSSAVYAFSTLMSVVHLPVRMTGRRLSFMIDDHVAIESSRAACWLRCYIHVRIWCMLGFHFGLAKCVLFPVPPAV